MAIKIAKIKYNNKKVMKRINELGKKWSKDCWNNSRIKKRMS